MKDPHDQALLLQGAAISMQLEAFTRPGSLLAMALRWELLDRL